MKIARGAVAAALVVCVALGAHAAGAQTTGEQIRAYDVRIQIQRDGTLRIAESITYDFGSEPHHGILRDLVSQESYGADQVRRYNVEIESVSAAPDTPSTLQTSTLGNYVHLRIGSPDRTITGVHRYRIVYTVRGAPVTFPTHDELNWDAIGNQWPVAIQNVRITVTAPARITRTACFAGPQGSLRPCNHAAARGTNAVFTQRLLGAFSGVTTVVAMPKGTIQPPPQPIIGPRPPPADSFAAAKESVAKSFAVTPATVGLGGGLAVLGIALVVVLATRRGPDRRYTGSAVDAAMGNTSGDEEPMPLFQRIDGPVEFIPPDGIRPGQVGTLADEQANLLDVTASIVDLAVRGWLTITEIESPGLFHHADYQLEQQKGGKGTLLPYEDVLLQCLFKDGASVTLSGLKYHFRESLDEIRNALYDDAVTQGWYRIRPDRTRRSWTTLGTIAIVAGVGVTWLVAKNTSFGIVPLALVLTGIVLLAVAHRMPARTGKGTAMLSRVRGFRRLFDEGEEDTRARFAEQHDIFSQYLPYAIVFGCTKKWAKAFEGIDAEQLQTSSWFVGNHPFDALVLAHAVDSFGTTATGTMYASMPSSSSSSGFSGGGFSGGGGGGGGGGSW